MMGKKSYRIRNLESIVGQEYIAEKFEQFGKELELESNVQKNQPQESQIRIVPYLSLFKYSTRNDKYYILGGILLAIIGAAFLPLINILYGDFCNILVDRQFPHAGPSSDTFLLKWFGGGKILENASTEERRIVLEEDARAWAIGCAVLSFFWFLFAMLAVFLLNVAAARQILRIRLLFFKAVICQDMAWFDTKMEGNFVGKIADNLKKLENGIGGVIGIFIHLVAIFIIGMIMAFFYGWELTLAILSATPIAIAVAVITLKMQSKLVARELQALTSAGKNAEEVFTCIRTVAAFGGEDKEVERYSRNLIISRICGIKQGLISGISDGLLWLLIYASYSIALGYGIRLIANSRENKDEIYTPATLLIIFYDVFSGLVNITFVMIHMQTFSEACGAAGSVFDVIESKGLIQPCSDAGDIGEGCNGEIEFRNVRFEYPARRNVEILKGINLKVKAGEIVAVVGESGSGKSTILQLIQRMYDPLEGEILLDGKNIKLLKVSWLRQQLGVVGQEPLLFSTTIRENILYGFSEATEDEIVEAAKKANAHDFIAKQINGYETLIGQKGSTLSGGQKQRIAIARALIRNPKILLLDEATSALDATSEKIVQATLDKAAVGRTTFIVTHKLSTISNVDRIIVLSDGVILEDGSPTDLYNKRGKYYELLQSEVKNIREKKTTEFDNETNTSASSPIIEEESTLFSPIRLRSGFNSSTKNSLSSTDQIMDLEKLERKGKFKEILKWNKPEWGFLIVGSLAAILAGAALPAVLILLGFFLGLLAEEDISTILHTSDIYVILIFVVGCISSICVFLQIYCLTVAGINLSERLRIRAFKSIVYQDMAWFDDEKNKVGVLCLKLTQEPLRIQACIGSRAGIILQAFSTAIIAFIVSLFFTWKLTLVTLAVVPIVFIGSYVENIFGRKPRYVLNLSLENASKIITEAIANIKVIASLGKESYFIKKYTEVVYEGKKSKFQMAWLQGFAFGIGQAGPFFCYAISLWYGGYLVATENLEYKYVLTVSEMLIFGTWTLGQCVVFLSTFREAKESAAKLQYLFTHKPQILDGNRTNFPDMKDSGILKFSKVRFAYPTRQHTPVLENFNATIKNGQSVAIMGPSGSGKSTVVQLLLRFYNPDFGRISINNIGTDEFKLSSLRQQFGMVSQEPVLFDRSVLENIAYGDNLRNVLMFEIVEAAKAANIHSFISSLPQGYETKLGVSGAHLSGGQKQRIAIARALIRNPQILLLDEATSALDPQSESVVQETLDSASSGRTTITIAHRLGAVRNADVIYVLDKGIVQEYGTHQELLKRGGLYFAMHEESEKKNT